MDLGLAQIAYDNREPKVVYYTDPTQDDIAAAKAELLDDMNNIAEHIELQICMGDLYEIITEAVMGYPNEHIGKRFSKMVEFALAAAAEHRAVENKEQA